MNILEAITQPSIKPSVFFVTYKPFQLLPADFNVTLTPSFSYIILDLRIHLLPVIRIDDTLKSKNLSLLIYYFHETENGGITVFNNQSLTYNFNGGPKCFEDPNPFKCEIKSTEIAIREIEWDPYAEFVAVRLSDTFDGCVFSETIFVTNNGYITGLANSKGNCDMILLIDSISNCQFSHLFTTATTENVKVYIGLNKKRLYFEFNSVSAKQWKNIAAFSRSYIIEIPKNSTLLIKVESTNYSFIVDLPYNSLITTTDFATEKRHISGTGIGLPPMLTYTPGNAAVKFTALYYSVSSTGVFYFKTIDIYNHSNTDIFNIEKIGDSLTFQDKNKKINIYYNNTLITDEVMLFIEGIKTIDF